MLLWGVLLVACRDEPPAPEMPPPLPPAPEAAALEAELELRWDERDQLATLARQAMQVQAEAAGLRRVEDVQVGLRCEGQRCRAQVQGTGLP